jgi:D-3-phosphoglycerate dehydrogenase
VKSPFASLTSPSQKKEMKSPKSPKTIRVLFLDKLPEASTNAFISPQYEIEEFVEDCSEAAFVKKIQEFQIVCLSRERPDTVLTDEVLRSAHRLLAIGVFGQIRNQVDIEVAKSLGIPVFTAPYQHQASAAELIISQIILLSRQIGDRSKEIHLGNWQKVFNRFYDRLLQIVTK